MNQKIKNKSKLKNNKNNKYKKKYTNKNQIGGSISKKKNSKSNNSKNSMIELTSNNYELIIFQNKNFDSILKDLKRDRYKINHWIWWVFPRSKPGRADHTKVTGNQEEITLFLNKSPMIKWIQILHLIIDIIKSPNPENIDKIGWYRCMNGIDHDKMEESIIFWTKIHKQITDKFPNFQKALIDIQTLKYYNK